MKCFSHGAADALAICKACCRGLCGECAISHPGGVVCKGRPDCEERVASSMAILARSKAARDVRGDARALAVVIQILIAIVYLGLSFWCRDAGAPWEMTIAAFMLAAIQFLTALSIRAGARG
jgi:hypothetical protein